MFDYGMPHFIKITSGLHSVLGRFPKLNRKIDSLCTQYHQIAENSNHDMGSNGERWLLRTLAGRNRLGIAFDVGANHGNWTAGVLEANPDATIHCFEVCPPTFQKLSARFPSSRGKVFLNSFGLSDSPGEVKIQYCPEGDGGTSVFHVVLPHKIEVMNARVLRGRDYCAEHEIAKIDCLKIDVEGAEHLVLRGFDDFLNPTCVPVVQFEYGMVNIVTKFLLRDFYAYFQSRGYKVGKLFPQSVRFREYRFRDEDFLGPNYVAAGPDLVGLLGQER